MPLPLIAAAGICCSLVGHVRASDGRPLVGAHVRAVAATSAQTTTDAAGEFRLAVARAGRYRVTIDAPGYETIALDVLDVRGVDTVDAALEPLGGDRVRTIGRITVDGRLAVPRAMVPTREIARADLEALGFDRAIDALGSVPSLTTARPNGGGRGVPSVVALRGPDPSETRITLDGQVINNANTGDIDLGQLPTSVLSGIDIGEGLGPSDKGGANTIGGEINFLTLRPTEKAEHLVRFSIGSFGATASEIEATGRHEKFGYALELGRSGQTGNVRAFPTTIGGSPVRLSSTITASSALANLTYDLSRVTTLRMRSLTLDDVRDTSAALNAPIDPSNDRPGGAFQGPGAHVRSQSIRATLVGASTSLGGGTFSATYAASSVGVAVDAIGLGPYDVSNVDRIGTTSLDWTRSHGGFDLALGGYVRAETLDSSDRFSRALAERSVAYTVRASTDIGTRLRLSASAIESRYSTFGSNLDGRIGARYATGDGGALRFSLGTGFRAPLLAELFTLPLADLPPDAHCVGVNGNPNLHPEHATEVEFGYGRPLGRETTADATLYRTVLRDPIEIFSPLGTTCTSGPSTTVAQSYPVNVGNVIYRGGVVALAHRFGSLFVRAEYGINNAYPTQLPGYINNPTSGSNVIVGQQFAGIPLQTFSLALRFAKRTTHAAADLRLKSTNNELNQGRYAILDAAFGKTFGTCDLTLAGRNLTNAVSGRFTRLGLGVPYHTPTGNAATDAFVIEPASLRLILSIH